MTAIARRPFLTTAAGAALGLARARPAGAATPPTCRLELVNGGGGATATAYVSGLDPNAGNRPGFVTADGSWSHLPDPSTRLQPLGQEVAVPLNAPGAAPVVLPLPHVVAGRIWFCLGDALEFFVNPGPALVQPDPLNPADPNLGKAWAFCELTFDDAQLYVNLSYVDLVALPLALRLRGGAGDHGVDGLPAGALAALAEGLQAQARLDGRPWDRLVTSAGGAVLRVNAPHFAPFDFGDYWDAYVGQVWDHYQATPLRVDTQGFGVYTGTVQAGVLGFPGLDVGAHPFTRPSTADVFGCNSGPLLNTADARAAVAARLGAALNRSTLLAVADQPDGAPPPRYYQGATTNHYARLVHAHAPQGYAFAYDDVGPTGAPPVDGHLQDPAPAALTVTVGGGGGGAPPAARRPPPRRPPPRPRAPLLPRPPPPPAGVPGSAPAGRPAGPAPAPARAADGQHLGTQPPAVQAAFAAHHGDGAAARWVTEHEAEVARTAP